MGAKGISGDQEEDAHCAETRYVRGKHEQEEGYKRQAEEDRLSA